MKYLAIATALLLTASSVAQVPDEEKANARRVNTPAVAPAPVLPSATTTPQVPAEDINSTAAAMRERASSDRLLVKLEAPRGPSRRYVATPAAGESRLAAAARAPERKTARINVPVDARLNTRVVNQTSSFKFVRVDQGVEAGTPDAPAAAQSSSSQRGR